MPLAVSLAAEPHPVVSDTLRLDWIKACLVGELLGFVPPAMTGVLLVAVSAPELVLVVGLVVAGIAEGAILGAAQNRVISRIVPGVQGWTAATATAAGLAWLAGMGGSSLVQAVGPVALIVAVPGWVVGLLAMGVLQWRRLRAHVDDAVNWIPYTTGAWLIGVLIPVVALSAVPNSAHLLAHGVAAVVAAVAMGGIVGVITSRPLTGIANRR